MSEPGPTPRSRYNLPTPRPETLYWRRNLRYLMVLLMVWFAISFGCGILFVDTLDRFQLAGFPLGFWFAQQGSMLGFVVIILVYVVLMNRLDKKLQKTLDQQNETSDSQ